MDRILIVCEGRKTEPSYFQAMLKDFRIPTAQVVVDGKSDSSPDQVVAYAIKRYHDDCQENGKADGYARVYCVLDRDEHSTYSSSIERLRTCQPVDVFYAVPSVPCFEFWLLLHFEYTTSPFTRIGERSPGDVALQRLKQHLPSYEKSAPNIYRDIRQYTDKALSNAKRVQTAMLQMNSDNPSTKVHELVEFLHSVRLR